METSKPTTPEQKASSTWERLEEFVRKHVQRFIQALLEEEVTELLRRTKSAQREAADAAPGYRNGYGKPRRLTLTSGTITVRRPLGRWVVCESGAGRYESGTASDDWRALQRPESRPGKVRCTPHLPISFGVLLRGTGRC